MSSTGNVSTVRGLNVLASLLFLVLVWQCVCGIDWFWSFPDLAPFRVRFGGWNWFIGLAVFLSLVAADLVEESGEFEQEKKRRDMVAAVDASIRDYCICGHQAGGHDIGMKEGIPAILGCDFCDCRHFRREYLQVMKGGKEHA